MRSQPIRQSDLPWLGVVLVLAAVHLRYALVHQGLPLDNVGMLLTLPDVMQGLTEGDLTRALRSAAQPSGWLGATLGALSALWGPSVGLISMALQSFGLAIIVGAALLARSQAGPWAALVTASLAGISPMIYSRARVAWFHIPEAALVVGAAVLLVGDRALERRRTRLGVAGLVLLATTLRPSGLLWTATLALLLPRANPRRVVPIALAWGLGLLSHAPNLLLYAADKLDSRARYAAKVSTLPVQIETWFGWLPFMLMLGLAAAGLWSLRGRAPRVLALLTAWLVTPVVLVLFFKSGMDNHPLLLVSLAVASGVGLAGLSPRLCLLAPIGFMAHHALVLLPADPPGQGWLIQALGHPFLDGNRPYSEHGADTFAALLDQSCPPSGRRCTVLTDQGLFHPLARGHGRYELALMGYTRVDLVNTYFLQSDKPLRRRPDAMSRWVCDASFPLLGQLQDNTETVTRLTAQFGLERTWTSESLGGCTMEWWEPKGEPSAPRRARQGRGSAHPPKAYPHRKREQGDRAEGQR